MDKRFLLFLVLSAIWVIFVTSLWQWLKPPEDRPSMPLVPAQVEEAQRQVYAILAATAAPPKFYVPTDLTHPDVLAVQARELRKRRVVLQREKEKAQRLIYAALAAEPVATAFHLPSDLNFPDILANKAEELSINTSTVVLGSRTGYKLRVVLSEQTAAVRSVTLNEYLAASRAEARRTDQPLVLVTDDEDGRLGTLPVKERLKRQSFRLLVDGQPIRWTRVESAGEWKERRDPSGNLVQVVFVGQAADKRIRVVKSFELAPDQYHVTMRLRFESSSGEPVKLTYQLTGPRGVPVEGQIWQTYPYRQIVATTTDRETGKSATRYLVTAAQMKDNKVTLPGLTGPDSSEELQFAGVMVQYFSALAVVDGPANTHGYIEKVSPEFLGDDPPAVVRGTEVPPNPKLQGKVTCTLESRPIEIASGQPVEHRYLLYTGPNKVRLLNYEKGVAEGLVDRYQSELHLNTLTDYPSNRVAGAIGFTSLVVFITNIMHWLLENLAWLLGGQYWAAIIVLTVLVRGAMFPVSRKQVLTSQRMQKLAPELKKLQEKYKDDKQALAQAQWELYRKYGVNPLSGCLVLFLQMPVFLGLYYSLYESIHLRLSGFLWIENLAAPDMFLYWGGWSNHIPLINLGPYLHILPIFAIAMMVVQQKLMTPPALDEQQRAQQKMMSYMMIFFGYLFFWVASGLCLYFTVSGAWGMIERKLLPKVSHPTETEKPKAAQPSPPRSRTRVSRNGQTDGVLQRIATWWRDLLEKAKKP